MGNQTKEPRTNCAFAERESFQRINQSHTYPLRISGEGSSSAVSQQADSTKRKWARRLREFIESKLFGAYFRKEAEYQADLVRCINALAETLDSREERYRDDLSATAHRLEIEFSRSLNQVKAEYAEKLAQTESAIKQHGKQLETLDSVARGLERIVSQLSKPPLSRSSESAVAASEASSEADSDPNTITDYNYLLLENRYRGSEEEISRRLSDYTDVFVENGLSNNNCPVLEIGSGRGELQTLFKAAGVASYGMDLDAAMVEVCREKGLDVSQGDALSHLAELKDSSLSGIIAIQVVEHLTLDQLNRLFSLSAEKVVSGGVLVFETINTESLLALAHNYFRDPTHIWPLHPETLRYTMDLSGLKVRELRKRSPYPDEVCLQELRIDPELPPRWQTTINAINHNTNILNSLIYGFQDYCIIAEVP
jgi:O-antigen chain-terminating methyltransferase